jgi:hypothetical protein
MFQFCNNIIYNCFKCLLECHHVTRFFIFYLLEGREKGRLYIYKLTEIQYYTANNLIVMLRSILVGSMDFKNNMLSIWRMCGLFYGNNTGNNGVT